MSYTKTQNDNIITYTCNLSASYIKYYISENNAHMYENYLDEDEIKMFIALLKMTIYDLRDNHDCKTVTQEILKIEWDDSLSDWTVLDDDDDRIMLISCHIDSAVEYILKGLGFGNLK
uniref:Uncharacterized protein n=1 Tax=viral metagenome TaxID=1070528 RepID=A0A6C0EBW6_9ZZZZ